MITTVHSIAAIAAALTLITSWLGTVLSELFGSKWLVADVKYAVPWSLLLLIPALALAGACGFISARNRYNSETRAYAIALLWVAGTGLLIFAPAAPFLTSRATSGRFDSSFWVVQAVELVVGAATIALLGVGFLNCLQRTDVPLQAHTQPAQL